MPVRRKANPIHSFCVNNVLSLLMVALVFGIQVQIDVTCLIANILGAGTCLFSSIQHLNAQSQCPFFQTSRTTLSDFLRSLLETFWMVSCNKISEVQFDLTSSSNFVRIPHGTLREICRLSLRDGSSAQLSFSYWSFSHRSILFCCSYCFITYKIILRSVFVSRNVIILRDKPSGPKYVGLHFIE